MFGVGIVAYLAIAMMLGSGGFVVLAGLAALTRLAPQLQPDFASTLPMGAAFFSTGFRWRMVNIYVGEDGVLLRSFWSTRMLPWATIAAVETVSVNGVFGDPVAEEVWFDLTDGSAADTPVRHAPWARTGVCRNVLTRYRYDEGFDELHAVVAERAAGEIVKKPATPRPVTHLSARQSPSWSRRVDRP